MVMEYMCHGDLLGFLRASRGHYGMYTVSPGFRNYQPPNLQLSSRDLLGIAAKVSNGMRFLTDRKVCQPNPTFWKTSLFTLSPLCLSPSRFPSSLSSLGGSPCSVLQERPGRLRNGDKDP